MAWIEVHQSLPTHAKTMEMSLLLDIPEVYCMGHVVSLWLWALDNAADGWVNVARPMVIARAARWPGEPGRFVDALLGAGFLDDDGMIHDWDDYTGRLMERRERVREQTRHRTRAWRDRLRLTAPESEGPVTQLVTRHKSVGDAPVTLGDAPTVPNPTVPNRTRSKESSTTPKGSRRDANVPAVPSRHQAVINAWLEAISRDPSKVKDYARYVQTGAEMAERGDTPQDVGNCTRYLQTDPWRQGNGRQPKLEDVRDALPLWIDQGRPAKPRPGTNGRAEKVSGAAAVRALWKEAMEGGEHEQRTDPPDTTDDCREGASWSGGFGASDREARPRLSRQLPDQGENR